MTLRDPNNLTIPFSVQDKGANQGPTGRIYYNSKGQPSTELTATVKQGKRYYNIPTLTPNQIMLRRLLESQRPTPEQLQQALIYANQNNSMGRGYKTLPDALAAENVRHQLLDKKFK